MAQEAARDGRGSGNGASADAEPGERPSERSGGDGKNGTRSVPAAAAGSPSGHGASSTETDKAGAAAANGDANADGANAADGEAADADADGEAANAADGDANANANANAANADAANANANADAANTNANADDSNALSSERNAGSASPAAEPTASLSDLGDPPASASAGSAPGGAAVPPPTPGGAFEADGRQNSTAADTAASSADPIRYHPASPDTDGAAGNEQDPVSAQSPSVGTPTRQPDSAQSEPAPKHSATDHESRVPVQSPPASKPTESVEVAAGQPNLNSGVSVSSKSSGSGSNSNDARIDNDGVQQNRNATAAAAVGKDSERISAPTAENELGTAPAAVGRSPSTVAGSEKGESNNRHEELSQKVPWLEKELRAAQTLIMQLQNRDNDDSLDEDKQKSEEVMAQMQADIQAQMAARTEAEDSARQANAQLQKTQRELSRAKEEFDTKMRQLQETMDIMSKEREAMKHELGSIREERDEQARKEAALTSRLNAAKKKEGVKANQAELYHDQVQNLESALQTTKEQLAAANSENELLKQELADVKDYSRKRIKQLESSLNGERKLNDERKQKMKAFVEAKTEEVRVAKADTVAMQTELDQAHRSHTDLNQRLKQLHAQWVQSQTRNRELQRDIAKMKKDSEMMHKVGGTLEMKLSKSAQETEEHKNKRLTAKNELMAVLKQLEAERDLNNRLRDSIKFTFTPKALSQQQTMQESLDELEVLMERLSKRFGRTLIPPPSTTTTYTDLELTDDAAVISSGGSDGDPSKPQQMSTQERQTQQLLSKLEKETQQVSQLIMSLSNSLERMDNLVSGPATTRSCVDALQQILLASQEQRTVSAAGEQQQYGQVSYSDTTATS